MSKRGARSRSTSVPRVVDAQARRSDDSSDEAAPVAKGNPEAKLHKFLVRAGSALGMLAVLCAIIRAGHVAVCASMILLQIGVFKELVNLRYREAKEIGMPWFRTLQWAWFGAAMGWAYGSSWLKAPMGTGNEAFQALQSHLMPTFIKEHVTDHQAFFNYISFGCYAFVFMLSVLSLNEGGLYKYQLMQFTWTVGTLLVVVVQVKVAVYSIYSGLFWFVFPFSVVVANDTLAYLVGFSCGRRFVKRPFLSLSPNKTWEGFVGGGVLTLVYAYNCVTLFDAPYFRCSYSEVIQGGASLAAEPRSLSCSNDALFVPDGNGGPKPIQMHAVALALFASVIAPFGGFFASAIKRAFDIKDFANFIPGHGGFMDRMDCQFLMMAITYVHYATFVATPDHSLPVGSVINALKHMSDADKHQVLDAAKASLGLT